MATCTGPTFSNPTFDFSDFDDNGNFYVGVDATNWDEGTKVKVNGEYAGMTIKTKGIKLCDYLTSNSVACGQDGTVEINIGPLMPQAMNEDLIDDIINVNGYIVAKTKVDGVYETCQVGTAPTSIQTASNPYVTGSSSASVISTLVGAFALVGLAGYAWKRHKSSTSENDADQRLYTGDIA